MSCKAPNASPPGRSLGALEGYPFLPPSPEAPASGILDETGSADERIAVIRDWVELEAWAEKLGVQLITVGDFLKLLEAIDGRYETQ